jgi:hypothetical protein
LELNRFTWEKPMEINGTQNTEISKAIKLQKEYYGTHRPQNNL